MRLACKGITLALFFQIPFTGLLEHCVDNEFPHGRRLAAERTFASSSTTPAALQAGFTEPMFAEKHHGILKNLPAYWAGEVVFEAGAPAGHCVFETPALVVRFI